jgi:iron complex transport system substrate-binding protein
VTEIIFALGQGRQIVAVDNLSEAPPTGPEIPRLDTGEIDFESMKKLKPEIFFTGAGQDTLAKKLKAAGFAVVHLEPRSVNELYRCIRETGLLLQCQKNAEELIIRMQRDFNEVRRKAALIARKPAVFCGVYSDGGWSVPVLVPEMIRLAGGKLSGIDQDPETVVCLVKGQVSPSVYLNNNEFLKTLRAARENHFFTIEQGLLDAASPRLVEGARRLFGFVFQVLH